MRRRSNHARKDRPANADDAHQRKARNVRKKKNEHGCACVSELSCIHQVWLFRFPLRFAVKIRIVPKPSDARPEAIGDCWEWIGCLNGKQEDDPKSEIGGRGYGRAWFEGKSRQVHRILFWIFTGDDPGDNLLDHLCRRRACCNPLHLEKTNHSVNAIRSQRVQEAIWRKLDAKRAAPELNLYDGCSDE